jgi:nucleotide-binding universal stress UspA family protein
MFTQILVPTDFSSCSHAALAHARKLAEQFGATLHVLHVLDNVFLRAVVTDPHALETAALRQLHECLDAEEHRKIAIVTALEKSDAPAKEIAGYAATTGIDLIVMGTHGRTGLSHVLLGSVAERVVRTAPCPVLTIREVPAPVHHQTGAAHVQPDTRSDRL